MDICRIVASYASRQLEPWGVFEPCEISDASAIYAFTMDSICVVKYGNIRRIWANGDTVDESLDGGVVLPCCATASVFVADTHCDLHEELYVPDYGRGHYERRGPPLANFRMWCLCCQDLPEQSCMRSCVVGVDPDTQTYFCYRTKLDTDGGATAGYLEQMRFRSDRFQDTMIATWGRLGDRDGEFQEVSLIAVSRHEKIIYIFDPVLERVQAFRSDGGPNAFLFGWELPGVVSLVVDPSTGDVYTGTRSGCVCVYDSQGNPGCRYVLPKLQSAGPVLVACSASGNVFALSQAVTTTVWHLV